MAHLQNESPSARLVRRARLNWEIGRSQGFKRLLDEKEELNPVARALHRARKWDWRRRHGVEPGQAVPVYLVGLQRSGTNMVTRGLAASPAFDVYNESNSAAFHRFQLRPDPIVRELVEASRHRYVLLKPLCDSHRVNELLDGIGTGQPGRAIWAFRNVDGRIRSALAHFGSNNLDVLAEIAAGNRDRWQAQGLSAASLDCISSFDYATITRESAAALFWYVRNMLFFEQGLDARNDVMLTSYDAFVAQPDATMTALCRFLDLRYDPSFVRHMTARQSPTPRSLDIDPEIRRRCDALETRLNVVAAQQLVRHAAT